MKKLLYLLMFYIISLGSTHSQDLTISTIYLPNGNVGEGSYITPYITVANKGTSLSHPSQVGFYLSQDSILSKSDLFLGSAYLDSLVAGGSDSMTTTLLLPDSLEREIYYLFAFADSPGNVYETNEKNNTAFTRLPIFPLYVDLALTRIYSYKTNYTPGDIFTANVEIYNGGNTLAYSSSIGYYLSTDSILDGGDFLLTNDSTSSVYPQTVTYDYPSISLPLGLTAGNYYLLAYADYGNRYTESDENNNVGRFSFSISLEETDLSVPYFTVNKTNVTPGSYLTTNTWVSNNGNSFVSNISVEYFLSSDSILDMRDSLLWSSFVGYLYPGTFTTDGTGLYIPSNLATGSYYVLAVVDNNHLISETNEGNNVKPLAITVGAPYIDLSIYGLSLYPSNVSNTSYLQPSLYEFNSGNSDAPIHSIGYFLSKDSIWDHMDTRLFSDSIIHTMAGNYVYQSPFLQLPSGIQTGNYFLLAVSDEYAQIPETNESNNVQAIPLTISDPYGDLYIESISDTLLAPLQATPGSMVFPQWQEINLGNSDVLDSQVGYYLSTDSRLDSADMFLGSENVSGLSPNSPYYLYSNLHIPANTEIGTYYLFAKADYLSAIVESNEENNVAFTKINVISSTVDLTVFFQSNDSSNIVAGSTIYPSVYEKNYGHSDAGYHTIGFYLSNDSYFDSTDLFLNVESIDGLTANNAEYTYPSLSIPASTPNGNYYILAITDLGNQIQESNEKNNVATMPMVISSPSVDLSIYGLTVTSPIVTAGSSFSLSLYEFNNGSAYSPSNYIGFYLSTDSVYDYTDQLVGTEYVYEIYGNSYSYLTPQMYMPSNLSNGDYYLIAVADNYGYVPEVNENDNTQAIRVTVGQNAADLVIGALSANTTNPNAGDFIYVSNTEVNQGNVNATGHYVGYFLSTDSTYDVWDTYLATDYLAGVSAWNSTALNPALFIPSSVPDGIYYIVVVADYGSNVTENNEYNNTKALRIIIGNVVVPPAGSDLSLISFYSYVNDISAGQSLSVHFADYNSGVLWAGSHNVEFYLSNDTSASGDDVILGMQYLDSLAPGLYNSQTTSLLIPHYIYRGNYYVIAMTDAGDNVLETNESNNSRSFPIVVNGIISGIETPARSISELRLFPNPCNGIVNFSTLDNVDEVEVSDLSSQVVITKSVSAMAEKSLDLHSLTAGIYLVKTLKDGVATSTNKLVISK